MNDERDNHLEKKEETKDNQASDSYQSFEVKPSMSKREQQRRKRFESIVLRTMREYNKWKRKH